MIGRTRPQPGGRPPGGVRLMREPGFAAHDSHLYKKPPVTSQEAPPRVDTR